MRNYKILYSEDLLNVEIKWSKPCSYENLKEYEPANEDYGYFYKILGKYSTKKFKLFYIGMTEVQYISRRLFNADHKKKRQNFQKDYPKHKLWLSVGIIQNIDECLNKLTIRDVESLLIYSCANDNNSDISNKQNKLIHKKNYRIVNSGFLEGMSKEIVQGLFYR